MATATLSRTPSPSRRRRSIFLRILLGVLTIVLLVIAAGAGWFYYTATSALPQLEGTIKVAGLTGPVSVIRDAHGVPHISASTLEDALFAQGFVTAQDRLWQMDMSRRFGRGQLSEVLGARTLAVDKRQRTLNLTATAERGISNLAPEERKYLDAYTRGVNALIERQMTNLPIEFRVLGYKPTTWTATDSMMVGVNISQSLNTQYPLEREREALIQNLPPEIVADLYPNVSWRDRPPSALPREQQHLPDAPPEGAPGPDDDATLLSFLTGFSAESFCEECFAGSNNWVISGARTNTGKPLLANDMHLGHSIPNVWYEVQVKAPGYNVVGVSFPGLPFVVAGHNERIAWGFTNVGPDVQDLYIENFNAANEYETPAGYLKPEIRHEVIKVKGEADVPLDVVITRHGPIVSGLFVGEARKIAMKWSIYDPRAFTFPFLSMGQAQDWKQFRGALANFGGAAQNVVYADVEGNIGYQTAGSIPIRTAGDGLLPVLGNTDAYEWTGFIPFDQLPSVYNPPSGLLATANGRITPDGYPYMVANQWGSPFRTQRIYRVLESDKQFSQADMMALQMDTYSDFDRFCAQRFVYAVDRIKDSNERMKQAADLLRKWDGKMEKDSAAATIVSKARRQLWRLLLEPKLGKEWEKYSWFESTVAMEKILVSRPKRWLPKEFSDFDSLLAAAVKNTVEDKEAPRKLSEWAFGKAYPIEIQHPIFGQVPLLKSLAGPGIHPQAGSSLTVKAAGRAFGASQRATYDMANLDASNLNIVVGQSGQIFTEHYMDHWAAWSEGKSFVLPFSEDSIQKNGKHRLTLQP